MYSLTYGYYEYEIILSKWFKIDLMDYADACYLVVF